MNYSSHCYGQTPLDEKSRFRVLATNTKVLSTSNAVGGYINKTTVNDLKFNSATSSILLLTWLPLH
jgi:hypothetical protein